MANQDGWVRNPLFDALLKHLRVGDDFAGNLERQEDGLRANVNNLLRVPLFNLEGEGAFIVDGKEYRSYGVLTPSDEDGADELVLAISSGRDAPAAVVYGTLPDFDVHQDRADGMLYLVVECENEAAAFAKVRETMQRHIDAVRAHLAQAEEKLAGLPT